MDAFLVAAGGISLIGLAILWIAFRFELS
jgi:hypothetical protein